MKLNEADFMQLLSDHQGIIRKVAYAYCDHPEDRNDLIQEITIQLWQSMRKYNAEFKLSTWIYRISLNVAISFYRKNNKRSTHSQPLHEETLVWTNEEEVILSENIRRMYMYISKLSELNRALILLYLDEYDQEEIASTLGLSRSNVATKISRIKQQLRKEFNLKK
jgi:RNA polymerase sigma-70 factor (ECF subfamily)